MKARPSSKPDIAKPLSTPCFCANLRRASRSVTRVYEEEFRSVGFTGATQYQVLTVLGRSGSVRQQDLGVLLDLDETTIARTLKPLFQKDWLRHEEGKDRREKWITLTPKGRQQLERARPAWDRAQSRLKKVLPVGMWDSLIESLPMLAECGERA
jgi:DNA-binding MarR family transcriptional regulator